MQKRVKPCKWYTVCPIKRFTEMGLLDRKWVESYCLNANSDCQRYQLEEKGQYHPDNMLPNGLIDPDLPIS
ncbi:MAG TPA: uracil-DNA glycosylase [Thermotogota bacterium]|nr:uracil-DNA glycosylase [Thermotogota bacterium]